MITQIRNNVIVSVTPAAEPDGRDRNVDWFYRGLEMAAQAAPGAGGAPGAPGGGGGGGVPYWGKYVFHDKDISTFNGSFNIFSHYYFAETFRARAITCYSDKIDLARDADSPD